MPSNSTSVFQKIPLLLPKFITIVGSVISRNMPGT